MNQLIQTFSCKHIPQIGLLCLLGLLSSQASGEPGDSSRIAPPAPKWSVELKFGDFEPETLEYKGFFEKKTTKQTGFAFGYKILRTLEFGLEYSDISEKGDATIPINRAVLTASNEIAIRENTSLASGDTLLTAGTYRLKPAHAYLLLRGIWGEDQIAVPYIGVGITKTKYEISVNPVTPELFPAIYPGPNLTVPKQSGRVDGKNSRYGLQFLLNQLDSSAAQEMSNEYGINNIYLYIEKLRFDAKVNGIDLGGETTNVGLLFEF